MPKSVSTPETVIVVDDDENFCALVARWLEGGEFNVATFHDGRSCFAELDHILPVCVCLDLNLPDADGLELLKRLKKLHRFLPVIILTGDAAVERAVDAIRLGAYDYLVKPVDKDRLLRTVGNAVEKYSFSLRISQLERRAEKASFGGLIGDSAPMHELFNEMEKVAASDISVLIHGESGTGKELIARAIHDHSGRKQGPFVALNCAAVPESLQESELFGHEKGAFTGATGLRKGKFELADTGTLFLDEVAELSSGLQAKLLRALQEKTYTRVGGSKERGSDFRLIAASHRDLQSEISSGRFREDLFFRIAVYELDVPPLRERRGDIALLSKFLFRKHGNPQHNFSAEAFEVLNAYDFPGNVRELENYVQRSLVSSDGTSVGVQALPSKLRNKGSVLEVAVTKIDEPQVAATPEAEFKMPQLSLEELEKLAIEAAIDRNSSNMSKVTKELGIGRTTLYRKLKKYELRSGSKSDPEQDE